MDSESLNLIETLTLVEEASNYNIICSYNSLQIRHIVMGPAALFSIHNFSLEIKPIFSPVTKPTHQISPNFINTKQNKYK